MGEVEIEWSRGGGFLYERDHVIARGSAAVEFVQSRDGTTGDRAIGDAMFIEPATLMEVAEPLEVIAAGRSRGLSLQPNHVFVSHAGGCACACGDGCNGGDPCCGVHPSRRDLDLFGWASNPFRANPFRANPFRANPFRANPFCGDPFRANPFRANSTMANTADPLATDELPPTGINAVSSTLRHILVLDTGLATHTALAAWFDPAHAEVPDSVPLDGMLDAIAGHGTFIAGLIARLAPHVEVQVRSVVSPTGSVSEWDIAGVLDLVDPAEVCVVNMSFGGPVWDSASLLESKAAELRSQGVALVASAGNDASCTPSYPAAFASVTGVGALGPDGPATFSNYGSWVDACADGVDLVSTFFEVEPFGGWARWSGTSFAAAVVTAALADAIVGGMTTDDAIDAVITTPSEKIPCLGTVVGQIPAIGL